MYQKARHGSSARGGERARGGGEVETFERMVRDISSSPRGDRNKMRGKGEER